MPPYSLRRLVWAGPVATFAAILASQLYYAVTKALGEQYLMPQDGSSSQFSPMPVSMPVAAVLIAGLLATIFFWLLRRFARRPETVFLSVSLAALLLSLGGPINLPAASMQTKLLLSGMHIIAATAIAGGILLMCHKDAKPGLFQTK
jgi:hypothetical protein